MQSKSESSFTLLFISLLFSLPQHPCCVVVFFFLAVFHACTKSCQTHGTPVEHVHYVQGLGFPTIKSRYPGPMTRVVKTIWQSNKSSARAHFEGNHKHIIECVKLAAEPFFRTLEPLSPFSRSFPCGQSRVGRAEKQLRKCQCPLKERLIRTAAFPVLFVQHYRISVRK